MQTITMQPIRFTSSRGHRRYGLVLDTHEPTSMLFVQWDAQRELLADLPHITKADWRRYGPTQGWVRVGGDGRNGTSPDLVAWDPLRRLAERVGCGVRLYPSL